MLKVASVKSRGHEQQTLHELTSNIGRTLLGFRRTGTFKVTVSSTKKFPYNNRLRRLYWLFGKSLETLSTTPFSNIFFTILALSQFTYYK
ncbi:hypothetical protein [Pseudomonas sp. NPDC089758]|uniref:hypothetical protein n=1 Tax=Pseudomonas sp. NPDC089758 TaxID=3364473 RepID=UPI00381B3EE3